MTTLFDRIQSATIHTLQSMYAEYVTIEAPTGMENSPVGTVKAVYVSNAIELNVGDAEIQTTSPAFDILFTGISGRPAPGSVITRESGLVYEVKSIEEHRDFYRCFVYGG